MISINHNFDGSSAPDNSPQFAPGQLVRHRRYGYRGVVVAADGSCQAEPTWYMSNKTQPDRNQPWYHVLVHESSVVTYAAESSLMSDDCKDPISHPMLGQFFSVFFEGRYIRNDRPWPA